MARCDAPADGLVAVVHVVGRGRDDDGRVVLLDDGRELGGEPLRWPRPGRASRSRLSGGSKKTGTKPARSPPPRPRPGGGPTGPRSPRLAMTLTTVQPRSQQVEEGAGAARRPRRRGAVRRGATVGATTMQVTRPVALFGHATVGSLGLAGARRSGGGTGRGPGRPVAAAHLAPGRDAVAVGGRSVARTAASGSARFSYLRTSRRARAWPTRVGSPATARSISRSGSVEATELDHQTKFTSSAAGRPTRSGRRPGPSSSGSARLCTSRSRRRGSTCFRGPRCRGTTIRASSSA